MGELRPEVQAFALLMEQKLQANNHKRHWRRLSRATLLKRLRQEVDELERALIDREGIAAEAADVANFAMMLADVSANDQGEDMQLPDIELVSAEVHEAWMDGKRAQGVTSRKSEKGEELMVPYPQLSELAKDLDRNTVKAVYAAIRATLTFS